MIAMTSQLYNLPFDIPLSLPQYVTFILMTWKLLAGNFSYEKCIQKDYQSWICIFKSYKVHSAMRRRIIKEYISFPDIVKLV